MEDQSSYKLSFVKVGARFIVMKINSLTVIRRSVGGFVLAVVLHIFWTTPDPINKCMFYAPNIDWNFARAITSHSVTSRHGHERFVISMNDESSSSNYFHHDNATARSGCLHPQIKFDSVMTVRTEPISGSIQVSFVVIQNFLCVIDSYQIE